MVASVFFRNEVLQIQQGYYLRIMNSSEIIPNILWAANDFKIKVCNDNEPASKEFGAMVQSTIQQLKDSYEVCSGVRKFGS